MPVATLKVEAETPLSLHGETAEKPMPAPNAISRRVNAAAAPAPAGTAAHDTAGCASTIVVALRRSVSIESSRGNNQCFRNLRASGKVPWMPAPTSAHQQISMNGQRPLRAGAGDRARGLKQSRPESAHSRLGSYERPTACAGQEARRARRYRSRAAREAAAVRSVRQW